MLDKPLPNTAHKPEHRSTLNMKPLLESVPDLRVVLLLLVLPFGFCFSGFVVVSGLENQREIEWDRFQTRLSIGMRVADLERLLGPPRQVYTPGTLWTQTSFQAVTHDPQATVSHLYVLHRRLYVLDFNSSGVLISVHIVET
jgi:hypothetical protein